jgi:PHD/YefM family antitoxin component YafN of YafNO toxin-antitoxin module
VLFMTEAQADSPNSFAKKIKKVSNKDVSKKAPVVVTKKKKKSK